MYAIKLIITGPEVGSEQFFEFTDLYLNCLYKSRQMINKEWQYEEVPNGLSIYLICPEKEAYREENTMIYGKQWKSRLETELKCHFQFKNLGIHPEYGETLLATNPTDLLLGSTLISPIRSLTTLDPLPLYKIPYTFNGDEYYDIYSWERNYDRVLGLWFSGLGDRWTQRQLQDYGSGLNKQGLACARKIEEVTKIPTYYLLFNHRAWSEKKDKARKCPNCENEWRIEGKTAHDLYAFKCEPCRLLSELSSNS